MIRENEMTKVRHAMNIRMKNWRNAGVSAGALALGLAIGNGDAHGQGFFGTGEVSSGAATISNSTNTSDIVIASQQSVIDWTPDDNSPTGGTIAFQSAAQTVNYIADPDFPQGYFVLNRINTASAARAVELNGTINSFIDAGSGTEPGGSIWFYTPGGIVVGNNASINVGSLVLTTSAPFVDGNGNFVSGGAASFSGAESASYVQVNPGASISALQDGSFIAMIAPRIDMAGNVAVNGSAALLAAESVDVTFSSNGLFDIAFTAGADALAGGNVAVSGTISGPASSGAGDNHRVYLAAIPKNEAITMMIADGASLGFDIAGAANIDGNAIVLSGGRDLTNGAAQDSLSQGAGVGTVDMSFAGAEFTSALVGTTTGDIDVSAVSGVFDAASDVTLASLGSISMNASGVGSFGHVDIAGNLLLDTSRYDALVGESRTAGHVLLTARQESTITVGADVEFLASAAGGIGADTIAAGSGQGGFVNVTTDGTASIGIGGDLIIGAEAFGGVDTDGSSLAGQGTGGTVLIDNQGVGISIGDELAVRADGYGGDSNGGGFAGNGAGGQITLNDFGADGVSVAGDADFTAAGYGGDALGTGRDDSGYGAGGTLNIGSDGGAITMGADLSADVAGYAGSTAVLGDGGDAQGGSIFVTTFNGGSLQVGGDVDLEAAAFGDSAFGSDLSAGSATGGNISVQSGGIISFLGSFSADLEAYGGSGSEGALAGDAEGGAFDLLTAGGTITISQNVSVNTQAFGGNNNGLADAGQGLGGIANIRSAQTGDSLEIGSSLYVDSSGFGGSATDDGTDTANFDGGSGSGGSSVVESGEGSLVLGGFTTIIADGYGGTSSNSGNGGLGQGGNATILTAGSGSISLSDATFVSANGSGGFVDGADVSGGEGWGGMAELLALGGNIALGSSSVQIVAAGEGGNAFSSLNANGGDAYGGLAQVIARNGDIAGDLDSQLSVYADATGGFAGAGGSGGSGYAGAVGNPNIDGAALVAAINSEDPAAAQLTSRIAVGRVDVSASGYGASGGRGDAGQAGGAGGNGEGGQATVISHAGGGMIDIAGRTDVYAFGFGGDGGAGGDGGEETGAAGGAGGTGIGGAVIVGAASGVATAENLGAASYADIFGQALGIGGAGGTGGAGETIGTGGDGGDGRGGSTALQTRGVDLVVNNVQFVSSGTGSAGGSGSTNGLGGDGFSGYVGLIATERFETTIGGSLTLNDFTATGGAFAGSGGTAFGANPVFFDVSLSALTASSIAITNVGNVPTAEFVPGSIDIRNGSVSVTNGLNFSTGVDLSVRLDNGTLDATSILVEAPNYVDSQSGPAGSPGQISADTMQLLSGGDLIIDADLNVIASGLDLLVPGDITIGNIYADSYFSAEGAGDIGAGNIVTDGFVSIFSGGEIDVGVTIAAEDAEFEAVGNVISAGGDTGADFSIDSGANITVTGNILVGVNRQADPELFGYDTGLLALGDVVAQDITNIGRIGLGSGTGSVTAGNLATNDGFLSLASTGFSASSISAYQNSLDFVYIADSSLIPLGDGAEDFNPNPIVTADPVRMGGPLSIGSGVVADRFVAATEGIFSIADTNGLSVDSAGDVSILAGTANVAGSLVGQNVAVDAIAGQLSIAGNISSGSEILLDASGSVSVGDMAATSAINVNAGGGALSLGNISAETGESDLVSSFSVGLGASGDIAAGDIRAVGLIGVISDSGSVVIGNVATSNSLIILANNAITTGDLLGVEQSGFTTYLGNSSQAALILSTEGQGGTVIDPSDLFAAPAVAINGTMGIGSSSGGNLFAAAGGDLIAPGDLLFADGIHLRSGGTILFNGQIKARDIDLASRDLEFGPDLMLGLAGFTANLTMRALASGETVTLGGDTPTQGYSVTQADVERIEANNVTFIVEPISADTERGPDLVVDDLIINGTSDSGPGNVTLMTSGHMRVQGNVDFANAVQADRLSLSAAQRLEIITPDGAISMTDASGLLSGQLTLSSSNIVAAALDLAEQIAANPEFEGRDEALATNPGAVNPAGYIQAGGISLLSSGRLLIQNTGTSEDFAGITAGGDGLIIGRFVSDNQGDQPGMGTGEGVSFVGSLITPNDVLVFDFTLDEAGSVILRTYSYAGGTNAAGQEMPSGGFDPILALFDGLGNLIDQNDDGGSANVPADPDTGSFYDTYLESELDAGDYQVAVTVFSNFAVGPTIDDGFQSNNGDSFFDRTPNFAFDVLGADQVDGPGNQNGPLDVVAFGRLGNDDGTFTTNDNAFDQTGFSLDNGVSYTETASFNGCLINTGCAAPPPPPPPLPSPPPPVDPVGEVVNDAVEDIATDVMQTAEQEQQTAITEEQEEEAAEEATAKSPITKPVAIISTRAIDADPDIDEPVSGGGNPALIGSGFAAPGEGGK